MKKAILKRMVFCAGVFYAIGGMSATARTVNAAEGAIEYILINDEISGVNLHGNPVVIKNSAVEDCFNIYIDENKNGIVDASETAVAIRNPKTGVTSADITTKHVMGAYDSTYNGDIFITNEAENVYIYGLMEATANDVTIHNHADYATIYGGIMNVNAGNVSIVNEGDDSKICGMEQQSNVSGDITIQEEGVKNGSVIGAEGLTVVAGGINITVKDTSDVSVIGANVTGTIGGKISVDISDSSNMDVNGARDVSVLKGVDVSVHNSNGCFYGLRGNGTVEVERVTLTAEQSYGDFYGAKDCNDIKGTIDVDVKDTVDQDGVLQKSNVVAAKVVNIEAKDSNPAIVLNVENAEVDSELCNVYSLYANCSEGAIQMNLKQVNAECMKGIKANEIKAESGSKAVVINIEDVKDVGLLELIYAEPSKPIEGDVDITIDGVNRQELNDRLVASQNDVYGVNSAVNGNVCVKVSNARMRHFEAASYAAVITGNMDCELENCVVDDDAKIILDSKIDGDVKITTNKISADNVYGVDSATVGGNVKIQFNNGFKNANSFRGLNRSSVEGNYEFIYHNSYDDYNRYEEFSGATSSQIGGDATVNIDGINRTTMSSFGMKECTVNGKTSVKLSNIDSECDFIGVFGSNVHDAEVELEKITIVSNPNDKKHFHNSIIGIKSSISDSTVKMTDIGGLCGAVYGIQGAARNVKLISKRVNTCQDENCDTDYNYLRPIEGTANETVKISYEDCHSNYLDFTNLRCGDNDNVSLDFKNVRIDNRVFAHIKTNAQYSFDHCDIWGITQNYLDGSETYKNCHLQEEDFNVYGTNNLHVAPDEPISESNNNHSDDKKTETPTISQDATDDKDKKSMTPATTQAPATAAPTADATATEPVEDAVKVGDVIEMNSLDLIYVVTNVQEGSRQVAVQAARNKNKTSIVIPKELEYNGVSYMVTAIADKAFANNKKIKTVTISSNVKTIGKSAFAGCTKLTKVIIGKDVAKIGSKAFYNCKALKTLKIITTKLTTAKVGSKAFKNAGKNNYSKLKFKVPSKKFKDYKKILIKKGLSKKAKITK